jgi:hypothetical protein
MYFDVNRICQAQKKCNLDIVATSENDFSIEVFNCKYAGFFISQVRQNCLITKVDEIFCMSPKAYFKT